MSFRDADNSKSFSEANLQKLPCETRSLLLPLKATWLEFDPS